MPLLPGSVKFDSEAPKIRFFSKFCLSRVQPSLPLPSSLALIDYILTLFLPVFPYFSTGCHAAESKGSSLLHVFPAPPLGIAPFPNCWQIETSGIQRRGKNKQLALAVPMPLFASSLKAGWLSSLAASTQSISCCMAGFRCKELGTISSGCHSEFCYCAGIERHLCAFTLKLWLT